MTNRKLKCDLHGWTYCSVDFSGENPCWRCDICKSTINLSYSVRKISMLLDRSDESAKDQLKTMSAKTILAAVSDILLLLV